MESLVLIATAPLAPRNDEKNNLRHRLAGDDGLQVVMVKSVSDRSHPG